MENKTQEVQDYVFTNDDLDIMNSESFKAFCFDEASAKELFKMSSELFDQITIKVPEPIKKILNIENLDVRLVTEKAFKICLLNVVDVSLKKGKIEGYEHSLKILNEKIEKNVDVNN